MKPRMSVQVADAEECPPNPLVGKPELVDRKNDSHSSLPSSHHFPFDTGEGHPDCSNLPLPTFQESDDKPFSFLSMIDSVLQLSDAAPVGLRSFLRLSMRPARNVHGTKSVPDLWPCPMPTWSWTAASNLSPARRRRRKLLQVRARALQMVIGVLNWECLGHPVVPPAKACVGFGYTDAQWDMVCRLERLVKHFVQPGNISPGTIGRSAEKFSSLLRVAQELPEYRDVDLEELVHSLSHDLDPYSKPKTHPKDSVEEVFEQHGENSHEPSNFSDPLLLDITLEKPMIAICRLV